MMEALGRLFNCVPIAAGKLISLKDAAGITFVCTGDDTFTAKSATTYNGSPTALTAITRYYSNTATDGSAAWTDSGDVSPVNNVSIASGTVAFFIDAADLPAGAEYVEVTVAASGLVQAYVHDLLAQRTPKNLRVLTGVEFLTMGKTTVASGIADRVASLGLTTAQGAGFTPANPTATASTSLVMMGLGSACAFTPAGSGLVLVNVTGYAQTLTAAAAVTVGARYGTGTAPANGAAVTGTRFGAGGDPTLAAAPALAESVPFAFTGLLQLAPGLAYWFDLALATANTNDHAEVTDVGMTIIELP